jgi:hypothetical protein
MSEAEKDPTGSVEATPAAPQPSAPTPVADPANLTTVTAVHEQAEATEAHDRSPWNWLLFVPIIVPLLTPLFNADAPRLFGFPRFYWLQLAFIVLGVASTTLVYQMTKKRG